MNLHWVSQNKGKLKFQEKSPLEKFDVIFSNELLKASNNFDNLIKRREYLNLEISSKQAKPKEEKKIQKVLSSLYLEANNHLETLKRKVKTKEKNYLGEDNSVAKILNEKERLDKLDILKTQEVKDKRDQKK